MKQFEDLVSILKATNHKIYVVESYTGGSFASHITQISGASQVFEYGFVTYSNQAKIYLDNTLEPIIQKYTAISKEVSLGLAISLFEKFNDDNGIYVSFTGNAGPTNSENKKVGLCFASVVTKDISKTFEFDFSNKNMSRKAIISSSIIKIAKYINNLLSKN
jgi:PncC family amidohydrolase